MTVPQRRWKPVTIDLTDNDTDVDGTIDDASLAIVQPANGNVVDNGDGTVSYTPDLDFFGTDTFTYTVLDDDGEISNEATVTVTVTELNDAPVANDDTATTPEDTPVTIDLTDNDTDVDGTIDDASLAIVQPANGNVVDNGDGTVSYTPDLDFFGTDTFTYTVLDDDGEISNVATVTVTVTELNDAPVANDDTATTPEDTPVTIDLTDNDTDVDGTIDDASLVIVQPANGNVVDNGDGTVSYTPDLDFFGTDTFTYTVLDDDGEISNEATVTVTVTELNDAPVANDDSATTPINTAVTIDLTDNDTDVDGTIDDTSLAIVQPANGNVVDNGDGTVSYTPDLNFFGIDTFTYTVLDDDGEISNEATVTVTVTELNDAPVANDDSATTPIDTPVTIDLTDNDTDVDGTIDDTSLVIVQPANGNVVDNGDGTVSYTPDLNFFGIDTFTYTVLDDDGEISNVATVTVTVTELNDAPVANDDSATTPIDTPVTIDLTENDTDVDGTIDDTSLAIVQPANGTVVDNGDGTVSYTPDLDFVGTDTFTYTVLDDDGEISNEATVTVTVTELNDAPVANDDSATTPIDTPVTIDLTENDTDVDGTIDDTSLVIVQPANGLVVDNGDGTVSYTPDLDFVGTDTFTYTVLDDDGEISNEATVTVTVTELNDAPVANDDSATTPIDTPVTIDLTENDTDVDGTIDDTSLAIVQPANGLVVDNGDGTVSYTPDLDFVGTDTFTYTVLDDDGEISNEATVTVTVTELNDAPVANDDSATTPINTAVAIDLTDNDTDVDGTIDDTSLVIVQPTNGLVVDNGDGTVSYTPDLDFVGTDTFTYTVLDDDGEISNVATVTVTVTELNDAPVANDDTATTPEDMPVTIDLTDNDTDVDGTIDDTSLAIVQPANGNVVDNGDGTVSYTPDLNFFGIDTFTYTVLDDDGEISNVATVTVTVTELNDAPVANDDSATTPIDTPVTIDLTENDTDVDGTIDDTSLAIVQPANGLVVDNGDGTVSYTPDLDFVGTDTFTYTVLDDDGEISNVATVTVTVTELNDAPVANDDSATTPIDTPVTIDLTENDTDVDGTIDDTSLAIVQPANGLVVDNGDGTVSYTPDLDFVGTDTFTYTVLDDDGEISNEATVTVTVTELNDAPVANDDSATTPINTAVAIDLTDNDTDVDGTIDDTSLVIVQPTNGLVVDNGDGTVSYTPDLDFVGTDTFTYTVLDDDGEISNVATVTVTVTELNDAPVANDDTATTPEDMPVTIDLTDNDTDVDGTIDDTSLAIVQPANGTVVDNGDGTVSYTPDLNFFGIDTFTYTVLDDDGEISNVATVTVTVTELNDAPVANDDTATTPEDTPVTIDLTDNDTDVDGTIDDTSLVIVQPANGNVVDNGDGTVSYTPDLDFFGTDTFTYTVLDDDGEISNEATVTVTVTELNDAPVANDDTATTPEDTPVTIDLTDNDTDVDGTIDDASLAIVQPANGLVVDNGDGTVSYTPDLDFVGTDTFTYTVLDDDGEISNVATVTVTVTELNDAPVANDDTATTPEDMPVTIDLTDNDTDVDGTIDDTSLAIVQPANGLVVDNGDGTVSYTPDLNFFGIDTFTYTVLDDDGEISNVATVTVTVTELNDAPVANDDTATTPEDMPVTIDLTDNDTDVDGTIDDTSLAIVQPTNGLVVDNGDGTVSYTPDLNFFGIDTFTYTVLDDDGEISNVATVTVTVTELNDAPVANDDTATTPEDTPVTIDLTDNDTDVDGTIDDTSLVIVQPANGNVVDNGDGTVSYTPDLNFFGIDTFTYTVLDDDGEISNEATVTVTVAEVNDAPVANDDAADAQSVAVISVLANDTAGAMNETDQTLTVIGTSDPADGSVVINPDGTLTYTPDADFIGTDSFTYTVQDDGTTDGIPDPQAATATVVITVNGAPLPGNFNDDMLLNCDDINILSAAIVASSNDLVFDMNGDGAINFDDIIEWLSVAAAENIGPGTSYMLGDANLDGTVDGEDFLVWNANKFTPNDAYCSGDFNADGFVSGEDFLIWNASRFNSAGSLGLGSSPGEMAESVLIPGTIDIDRLADEAIPAEQSKSSHVRWNQKKCAFQRSVRTPDTGAIDLVMKMFSSDEDESIDLLRGGSA